MTVIRPAVPESIGQIISEEVSKFLPTRRAVVYVYSHSGDVVNPLFTLWKHSTAELPTFQWLQSSDTPAELRTSKQLDIITRSRLFSDDIWELDDLDDSPFVYYVLYTDETEFHTKRFDWTDGQIRDHLKGFHVEEICHQDLIERHRDLYRDVWDMVVS
jgi:hypothetical protein